MSKELEIVKKISMHKDYGKRNPLDIGLELGYSQSEIFEALSIQGAAKEEEQIIYFLLGRYKVAAVNLLNRKVSLVKKLDKDCEAMVKDGILVWANKSELGMGSVSGTDSDVTKINWENLNTGESGVFSIPKQGHLFFHSVFIVKDGVLIFHYPNLYKCEFTGNIIKKVIEFGFDANVVVQDGDMLYMANMFRVWRMNRDLEDLYTICEYSASDNKTISALEKDGDEVYYHIFDESGLWNNYYYKYSITGSRVSEDPFFSGSYTNKIGFVANPIEIVTTKNYKVHRNAIYTRNSSQPVWGAKDGLTFLESIVSLYEQDILLCRSGQPGKPVSQLRVTLFDLSKRKTPVFLPLDEISERV